MQQDCLRLQGPGECFGCDRSPLVFDTFKPLKVVARTVESQVRKVDPVPASSLKATQRKSGDRVHLPDLRFNARTSNSSFGDHD